MTRVLVLVYQTVKVDCCKVKVGEMSGVYHDTDIDSSYVMLELEQQYIFHHQIKWLLKFYSIKLELCLVRELGIIFDEIKFVVSSLWRSWKVVIKEATVKVQSIKEICGKARPKATHIHKWLFLVGFGEKIPSH